MTSRHVAKGRGVRHVGSPRGKPLTVTRKQKASKKQPTVTGKQESPRKPRMTLKARQEQFLEAKRRGLNPSDAGQVLMDSGATLGMVLRVKRACGDAR